MRYNVWIVLVSIVVALFVPNITFGQSEVYISDAIEGLQSASVYVYPGTEKTDSGTAAKLEVVIQDGDNIVLVMFPAVAEEELGINIDVIARRLSDGLHNDKIIGLAVGEKVLGYAPMLPLGVVTDQMNRAESVSNSPITALITFAQNIHLWQERNPEVAVPPISTATLTPTHKPTQTVLSPVQSTDEEKRPGRILSVFFALIALCLSLFAITYRKVKSTNTPTISFNVPKEVNSLLCSIMHTRERISDGYLRSVLQQLCLDIERYFNSSSLDRDKDHDVRFFTDRLMEVGQVIDKYIDIQDNPRYYNNPETRLQEGRASVTEFAQYVLESISRGNDVALVEYRADTDLLNAQRRIDYL